MVQAQWLQQKMKFLLGFNLKIVIQWAWWTFGWGILLGEILASAGGGIPSILQAEKTLSSGFILKTILHRVVGFNCIAW